MGAHVPRGRAHILAGCPHPTQVPGACSCPADVSGGGYPCPCKVAVASACPCGVLRTSKARASMPPGGGAGVGEWVDNNANCSIFVQLTVNSLQGDSSQLVRQDVPQPTEGSWAEGTSMDYNLSCWLEAVIALTIAFLCPAGTTANGRLATLW